MAKDFNRARRVGELVKRELASLIASELKDPRVGMVTITGVDVTKDLRQAKVYVACLGSEQETETSVRTLNNASGFLRRSLSQHVDLRVTPSLQFCYDSSIERGVAVSHLIDQVVADIDDSEAELVD